MLTSLRVLSATGGLRDRLRSFGLRYLDRPQHLLGSRILGRTGLEQELEQHRALEFLYRVGDLVPRPPRRIPLGDDHLGMRDADAQRRLSDLSFPDDISRLHASKLLDVQRMTLRSARALVGPRLDPVTPAAIAVEGTRVVGVDETGNHDAIDLGDLTLLPGFIDAHVHIALSDPLMVIRGGVTTARDLAWPPREIHALAERSRESSFDGPLIVAAGAMLTVPNGYPTRAAWAPAGTGRVVESPADAAEAVGEQADAGAVVIKVALNAAVGPTFDRATLRAVCDAAHGRGLRVTAHIFGLEELVKALDAGVDEMAHVLLSRELIPDSVLDRMVAQEMVVVPTLSIADFRLRRIAMLNLAGFWRAGGRVVYGTDLGNAGPRPGIDRREIDRMVRSGMDGRSIVQAGTTVAAQWLGFSQKGSIAPGMDADIIGVPGDPLDAAVVLTDVRFVMREGRVLRSPEERT